MKEIKFTLTAEQAKDLCKAVGKDINKMEEFEICELVDRAIDDFVIAQMQ